MNLAQSERRKYEKIWQVPGYGKFSPAEEVLPLFRQMVKVPWKKGVGTYPLPSLVDIGCGTGRASKELEKQYHVWQMDFVDAREDDCIFTLYKKNIWGRWDLLPRWNIGFCCDVMEHIPTEKVDAALRNISNHTDRTFFRIDFEEDNFGKAIGEKLHLTVRPFTWWRDKLGEFGKVNNARDLLGWGVFDVRFT